MHIVDYAIICALEEEWVALVQQFPGGHEKNNFGYRHYFGDLRDIQGEHYYRIVIVKTPSMGNLSSFSAAQKVITCFAPSAIILAGICGGIQRDGIDYLRGDVCVSNSVVYYEPAKYGKEGIEQRSRMLISPITTSALSAEHVTSDWSGQLKRGRPGEKQNRTTPPVIHRGTILSGEKVIADSNVLSSMTSLDPEAISVEMEAAGVAMACIEANVSFLIIKAASDFADSNKDDAYREFAAEVAAVCTATYLQKNARPSEIRAQMVPQLAATLFGFDKGMSNVMLPGRPNKGLIPHRWARDNHVTNYPPFDETLDYDDMWSVFHVAQILTVVSNPGEIKYTFDSSPHGSHEVDQFVNQIYIGSPKSNVLTSAWLKDKYYTYGDTHDNDRNIVGQSGEEHFVELEGDRPTNSRHGDKLQRVAVDYGLISCFHDRSCHPRKHIAILSGCRAYGQIASAMAITDPRIIQQLLLRMPDCQDFQCVVRAVVHGHQVGEVSIVAAAVFDSSDHKWKRINT